jgi:hypothetical protein
MRRSSVTLETTGMSVSARNGIKAFMTLSTPSRQKLKARHIELSNARLQRPSRRKRMFTKEASVTISLQRLFRAAELPVRDLSRQARPIS